MYLHYTAIFKPYKPGVLLWNIGKQNSPRCDAEKLGSPSGAILFAEKIFIEKLNKNEKNTPDVPKNENGLIQMIRLRKSIRHMWVKSINCGYSRTHDLCFRAEVKHEALLTPLLSNESRRGKISLKVSDQVRYRQPAQKMIRSLEFRI